MPQRPALPTVAAAGAGALLFAAVLAGCSSGPVTQQGASSTSSTAAPTNARGAVTTGVPATCSSPATGVVQCQLPESNDLTNYNLATLVGEADAVDGAVTDTTPLVMTAFGGWGADGYTLGTSTFGAQHGGAGGSGGEAQTATTESAYVAAHQSPVLYYYLGETGLYDEHDGANGGSSTIVATKDLQSTSACIVGYSSCTSTDVLLDAGGGGGGGAAGTSCAGGYGGSGGAALATTSTNASKAGAGGDSANCTGGHGGHGGDFGAAGPGGDGGDGATSKAGKYGSDGVGGLGGPVHNATKTGPGTATPWQNASSLALGSAGQGGEGEWHNVHSTRDGGGGGGGGGFGGGGGGGAGGQLDPGGGGGGGGSYAVGTTATPGTFPTVTDSASEGEVLVTFVAS
ncbi:MAG: hypothetical protein ACRDZR_14815 [Acidimicrobiales bacterium]